MNSSMQRKFVRDLSQQIVKDFCELQAAGHIPESWDGHELRCWLAYKHEQSASMTWIRQEPRSKRAKEYKNDIIIHNL